MAGCPAVRNPPVEFSNLSLKTGNHLSELNEPLIKRSDLPPLKLCQCSREIRSRAESLERSLDHQADPTHGRSDHCHRAVLWLTQHS